jgi:hypothetical protein
METKMKRFTGIICLMLVVLAGAAFGQSWQSAITTGMTSVAVEKSGDYYTLVLTNMTGIATDTTVGYDVLVWTLEPFNLPTPEAILETPAGWGWQDGHWSMYSILDDNAKYYNPPALSPGHSYTFRFMSSLTDNVNPGGPSDGNPAFLCHVAAVDPTQPGSAQQQWSPVTPSGMAGMTWFDRSTTNIPPVPEPGSLFALAAGVIGMVGTRRIWSRSR